MKEIKAIIQPFQKDKVVNALRQIPGLPGCIVSEVETFGKVSAESSPESLESTHRTKLEIVVSDDKVGKVLSTIQKAAHTGNPGDGKVFVMECVDAMRIRTGERGEKAL